MSLEFARLSGSMAPICDIFHILIKRLGDFFVAVSLMAMFYGPSFRP